MFSSFVTVEHDVHRGLGIGSLGPLEKEIDAAKKSGVVDVVGKLIGECPSAPRDVDTDAKPR